MGATLVLSGDGVLNPADDTSHIIDHYMLVGAKYCQQAAARQTRALVDDAGNCGIVWRIDLCWADFRRLCVYFQWRLEFGD